MEKGEEKMLSNLIAENVSVPMAEWFQQRFIEQNDNSEMDLVLLNQIKEIKKKGNFRQIRKEIGDGKLREFIHEIYPSQSIMQLEKTLGVPDSSLGYWFKQLGIPSIRNHVTNISLPASFNLEKTLSNGKRANTFSAIKITPDLAYLVGFALGDGSVQKYMVEVFNQDYSLHDWLLPIMKKYGVVSRDTRSDGLWRLRLSSVKIANLIKVNKKIREDTLDYILSDNVLANIFIAAFWDAEGTVRRQGKYYHLYLYNTNLTLLNKIGQYLQSIGIAYSVHTRFDDDRNYRYPGRKVVSTKPIHRFCVPKDSFTQWIDNIGIHMKHTKKRAVIREMINQYGGGSNYE